MFDQTPFLADPNTDPILVVGTPRSGSTWMQFYLSQHPRVHIAGQFPNLNWSEYWNWFQRMARHGQFAVANQQYEIPHYAGSDRRRCQEIFRRMFCSYITGLNTSGPRWGGKFLSLCYEPNAVEQFESFWPTTRWVVCLRDPFTSLESEKNTFVPDRQLDAWCKGWVEAADFARQHDSQRTILFQIDQVNHLEPNSRLATGEDILHRIGETPSQETRAFLKRWPRVHKVKPDSRRSFQLPAEDKHRMLAEIPGLEANMVELGYL